MANTLTLTTASGQTLARHSLGQSPLRIQAVDNVYYQLNDDNGLAIQNVQAGRAGNDLLISVPGEAPITVENYFLFDETGLKNPLLGLQSNGQYLAYPIADSVPIATVHQLAEEMAMTSTTSAPVPPAAIVAGVLGIGAAGIALASGNNNNDSPAAPQQPQTPFDPNNNSPTPTPNPTPTPTPTPNPNPNPNPNPTPNKAPTDIALSTNNIMEGKDGATVGQLTTTDPDANDTHTYTVSDNRFEVINGELKLKAGQILNFTNEPTITLNITSTDSGSLSTSKTFTLNVQDDPNYPAPPQPGNRAPTDIALSANNIMEGKDGAVVGQLTTTDPDTNDTHTYTVSDSRFEVINGELKLKAGEILNFTHEPSISLTITSTDSGSLSTSKTFTLNIQDDPNYPAPQPPGKLGVYVPAPLTDFVANVTAATYGAKGDGQANDTAAIQKAIDAAEAAGGGIVDVPAGTYMLDAVNNRLHLKSNVILRLDDHAVLKAIPNDQDLHDIIRIRNVDNAHILGGTLQGERDAHQGTTGEGGHGIRIMASTNVVIEGVTARDMWGDGIYLGKDANFPTQNENITIYNVTLDNNRRQGLTVTHAKGVKVFDSEFLNNNATEPKSGINLEPNANQNISDVDIRGNTFSGNNIGFLVANNQLNTRVTDVTFENNTLTGNPRDAIILRGLEGGKIINNIIHQDPDADRASDSGGIRLYNGILRDANPDPRPTTNVDISGNTLYGGTIMPRETTGNTIHDNQFKAAVFIRGEAKAGETLTAAVYDGSQFDENNVTYQWYANGQAITGANGKTYDLLEADKGKVISVAVQFRDNAGEQESASSAQTAPIAEGGAGNQNQAPSDIQLSSSTLMEGQAGIAVGTLHTTDPDANDTHTYAVSDNRFEVVNGTLKLKAGEILNFTHEPSIPLTITSTDAGNLSTSKDFTLQVQDDPNYPAPAQSAAEVFAQTHLAGKTYEIVDNLAQAKAAANANSALHYIVISDGEHHAILQKNLEGYTSDVAYNVSNLNITRPGTQFMGMAGWSADFGKAGYVPLVAFMEDHQAKNISAIVNSKDNADNAVMYAARLLNLGVEMPVQGQYEITQRIVISNNVKYLHGNGSTITVGAGVTESALKFRTASTHSEIDGLVLDMNGQAVRGILGQGVKHIVLSNNTITNTYKMEAIAMSALWTSQGTTTGLDDITIRDNHIKLPHGEMASGAWTAIQVAGNSTGELVNGRWVTKAYATAENLARIQAVDPTKNTLQELQKIYDHAQADDANNIWWGTFTKGVGTIPATHPDMAATNITIQGNTIEGGRYGIGLVNVDGALVSSNYLSDNTRAVSAQNNNTNIIIENNLFSDFLSAGILLGYNSDDNTVRNNILTSSKFVGQAPVIIDQGSENNHVHNNRIIVSWQNKPANEAGIGDQFLYAGSDVSNNRFIDNVASGIVDKSGIGIEAIWDKASAAGESASYVGSPNFPLHYNGGNGAGNNVVVRGNIIAPESKVPGVYLGADTSKGWNRASTSDPGYLYPERDIVGHLNDLELRDNVLLGNASTEHIREHESADGRAKVNGDTDMTQSGGVVHEESVIIRGETAYSIASHTLDDSVNHLILLGNNALEGTGNAHANILLGNQGDNQLYGQAGNDVIDGGYGQDTLHGGAGADIFLFQSRVDGKNIDTIADFSRDEGDKIALSDVIFGDRQGDWFAAEGEAKTQDTRILQKGNALYYDADGSGQRAEIQFATLDNGVRLQEDDFIHYVNLIV